MAACGIPHNEFLEQQQEFDVGMFNRFCVGIPILRLSVVILLAACSGIAGKKSSVSEDHSDENSGGGAEQSHSFQVAEQGQLPACNGGREGSIAYVKASKKLHACENGEWKEIEVGSPVRNAAADTCSISKSSGQSSITCGSSTVSIRDGIAADGTACSVSKTGAVATLTCGQNAVSINDGAHGLQGSAGANCSVSKSGLVANVQCGGQTVQVLDGTAGQGCSVSKTGTTATVVCGGQSITLTDGLNGAQGVQGSQGVQGIAGLNGHNSLVRFTDEPSGANCLGGGTKFLSGLDNGDGGGTAGNGQLENGEVDSFSFLCRNPSSFAVAGQKIVSAGTVIGTILSRFQMWKHDYNTYFLIPSDELFLVANSDQSAKALLRASRVNSNACSGRVVDNYSIYETCADYSAPLAGHTDSADFSVFYSNANCTGTAYVGRSGSFYVNQNTTSVNSAAFLDFVAAQGSDVFFKSDTQWMKLTSQTAANVAVKSRGGAGGCVLVCYQSDYCSEGWNNNVTLSAYPFSYASPAAVGIPLNIPAGWQTY